jgi:hypothetical protein
MRLPVLRRRLRRHRAALLALLCAGIAIVLVLLAADVSVWQSTVARDDLRFRALPAHRHLWRPPTTLPGDPASLLLGTGSTISYRNALQYFWFSRIGSNPEVRQDTPTLRATAQNKLLALIAAAPNAQQRSTAANLLGVLIVTTPTIGGSGGGTTQVLTRATQYFQQAIELYAGNADAKQNLELVLRIQRPGKGRFGHDARSGYGFGRGRGVTSPGGGY